MSDQCPSSKKAGKPVIKPRITPQSRVGAGAAGVMYSRSGEDRADSPEFRSFLEREFPDGASEISEATRRTFLKLMGAGAALAGAATIPGCRQPDHKILPYSRNVPEEIVPGKSLFYATSMPLPGGGAEGLLIETQGGRPTKAEGNPLHAINRGKSSVWAQSSVLDLYDPDRLKGVQRRVTAAAGQTVAAEGDAPAGSAGNDGKSFDDGYASRTWDDFVAWCRRDLAEGKVGEQGENLAFVVDRKTSITLDAAKTRIKAKWPKASWVSYDAFENFAAVEGSRIAFGKPMREVLKLERASVIVSLDRDFLHFEPGSLPQSRGYASKRKPMKPGEAMNRLYVLESNFSITGASADHRFRMSPQQTAAAFVQIAKYILSRRTTEAAAVKAALDSMGDVADAAVSSNAKALQAIAEDLLAAENAGKSAIIVGPSQNAAIHALAAAVNAALGNIAKDGPIGYLPMGEDEATAGTLALADVARKIGDGKGKIVVVLGTNPVFTAPIESGFAAAFAKAEQRVVLSADVSETSALATWRLNQTHYLEQWGDTVAVDGTIAPIQPMIAPLYAGKSDVEVLAIMLGDEKADGYTLTREALKARLTGDFERAWRLALHNGVVATAAAGPDAAKVNFGQVGSALAGMKFAAAPSSEAMHLSFTRGLPSDGRFANNAWIHELADAASKIVWDNAAYISPKTANELDLHQTAPTSKKQTGRMADLTIGGRTMQVVCWALPGVPDNTVVLPLGFGRRVVGLVGQGVGFDAFPVRSAAEPWSATGVTLKPTADGERYHLATTQNHWSMEGRALIREADKTAWDKFGAATEIKRDTYGREMTMKFGEKLEGGELNVMPAPLAIMLNPYDDVDGKNSKRSDRPISEYPPSFPKVPAFSSNPQWGMSIDLSSCTGCNVCTVACQAENNIPVVGKIEVNKGREMHWIRIDRYFKTDEKNDWNDPVGMIFQPVACVHCENAPCETVCPVNATVHGPEGHNYMVYNRCIGTRYCANNCPYKVRRFNFFDYGVTKFNGGYLGDKTFESVLPGFLAASEKTPHRINPNLIPPRLRDKLDEISRLGKNPNVTIRSRGVMEKCTYCIQRTNEAKIELKIKGIRNNDQGVPDGYVQTACQQACPSDAITFGDIRDTASIYKLDDGTSRTGSLVHQMREHERTYALLGYLAVRPRTTYMVRVNNPNPNIRTPDDEPFGPYGGHGVHKHEAGKPHAMLSGPGSEVHFIDPHRAGRDGDANEGYVMSLSVLTRNAGGRA